MTLCSICQTSADLLCSLLYVSPWYSLYWGGSECSDGCGVRGDRTESVTTFWLLNSFPHLCTAHCRCQRSLHQSGCWTDHPCCCCCYCCQVATRDNVTTGPNSGYVTQSADSPSSYHTLSLKWIGTVLDFHDKIALVRCYCLKSGLFYFLSRV